MWSFVFDAGLDWPLQEGQRVEYPMNGDCTIDDLPRGRDGG